jgi:methionine-rich copper-binding protein CopC
MRLRLFLVSVAIALFAFSADAGLITIFNYTPPAPPPFQIISSSPAANQQLSDTPKSIVVTFSQNVLVDKSTLQLYDQYNSLVNTVVAEGQSATNTLKIEVPGKLLSGTYRVDVAAQCLCTGSAPLTSSFYFSVY